MAVHGTEAAELHNDMTLCATAASVTHASTSWHSDSVLTKHTPRRSQLWRYVTAFLKQFEPAGTHAGPVMNAQRMAQLSFLSFPYGNRRKAEQPTSVPLFVHSCPHQYACQQAEACMKGGNDTFLLFPKEKLKSNKCAILCALI